MRSKFKAGLLSCLILISLTGEATGATCRATSAAQAGSDTGYERARNAADAWSEREKAVSSSLQSCLSRIEDITLTLPQFPSIAGIISKIAEQICQAAVDKVNEKLPGNIDPWKDFNPEDYIPDAGDIIN
ncbi:conjugal transfer protein [Salmonella enterica]|nr:conjugal transfer protein [Salmonella enterica]